MPSTRGPSFMGVIMHRLGPGPQNGSVREVSGAELLAAYDDPFVQHQTDPAAVVRAFVRGRAAVIESVSHMPGAVGTLLMALGPTPELAVLTAAASDVIEAPGRVSVPVGSFDALPRQWRPLRTKQWHWMSTRTSPALPSLPVEEVDDADEVNALLDAFAPDAHARPGSPRVECWLGLRENGVLLAVGALARQHDRTGHLRAVTVVPEARGRGIGRELSAALTLRALDGGSGVATLGVYVDNTPAVAVYGRLGYEVLHTFASGPIRE